MTGPTRTVKGSVELSVVVPAYRAEATLGDCIRSVLAQDLPGPWEVILVVSGVAPGIDLGVPDDPRLHIQRYVERVPAAQARNAGVARARGGVLVFTDADVVANPGWLRALVSASLDGQRAVAGGVVNGTPTSAMGTVEYLVEFLDCHPRRPPGTAWHGATCNLLVPRHLWARYGPFPEDLDGGEDTLLTVQLRRDGLFVFSGSASVIHRNRTAFAAVVRHQYEFGRFTARLGRRTRLYKAGVLVRHTVLAPVAAVGRLVSLYARVVAWDREHLWRAMRLAPGVVVALAAWGAGLFRESLRQDRLGHHV